MHPLVIFLLIGIVRRSLRHWRYETDRRRYPALHIHDKLPFLLLRQHGVLARLGHGPAEQLPSRRLRERPHVVLVHGVAAREAHSGDDAVRERAVSVVATRCVGKSSSLLVIHADGDHGWRVLPERRLVREGGAEEG